MARTYPRIGPVKIVFVPKDRHPQCKLCGESDADARIDIQFNAFRGDDEVVKVHIKCYRDIPEADRLNRLLSAISKAK